MTAATIFAAYYLSAKNNFELIAAAAASIAGALTAAGGNVINDIFDIETDKINRNDRPIPSGKISARNAYVFYAVLNTAAVIVSLYLAGVAVAILCVTVLLLFLYSGFLKRVTGVSNITVAFMTGLAFIFGGTAAGNIVPAVIPAAFAFLINLIREIVKDNIDVPGDKNTGIITIPVKYGDAAAKNLNIALIILLVISVNIPFFSGYYKAEYIVIINLILNPLLLYIIKLFRDNYDMAALKKASGILKLNMLIGLLAILAG
jgi:geranylgeranylglycerol-phosphate geranylgeranyltransferase